MLASSNYYFSIYQPAKLPSATSSKVKNASDTILQVLRNWFDKHDLPWDESEPILSDYVPFLFAGIPCAGTFSGTDTIKTSERRDRYGRVLGHGYDGIAGIHFDSCYHQACDTIENINPFGYETMVKSAAHVLETLARIFNLNLWLYE
ncbi:unnamed protein product [Rotaria socialis]|uniref:Peptidase M28 domain-containing protein n=1 Tax=Rotaria socialis TaxID=392032 RepID=A0A820NN50_9BILA|nr:unnamed protein product [Rotaria socialis]CAF4394459.1 unnamed protein product [Rotaria socialis]